MIKFELDSAVYSYRLKERYPQVFEAFRCEYTDNVRSVYIYMDTIEDILKLSNVVGHDLIISKPYGNSSPDEPRIILIYDGYVE